MFDHVFTAPWVPLGLVREVALCFTRSFAVQAVGLRGLSPKASCPSQNLEAHQLQNFNPNPKTLNQRSRNSHPSMLNFMRSLIGTEQ